MTIGTKSMLFGVHAFWWHPFTVWLAWVRLYRALPGWPETVAIVLHDQYWGCPNIDGVEGKRHPMRGARWAGVAGGSRARVLALTHSRSFCATHGLRLGKLCAPDKLSIFFDPEWFYLLRARLSGELPEFISNAVEAGHVPAGTTGREWLAWYKNRVKISCGNP